MTKAEWRLTNHHRLDVSDTGWNAFILSEPNDDLDDWNPHGSQWPESEMRAEFTNGWLAAEEASATHSQLVRP